MRRLTTPSLSRKIAGLPPWFSILEKNRARISRSCRLRVDFIVSPCVALRCIWPAQGVESRHDRTSPMYLRFASRLSSFGPMLRRQSLQEPEAGGKARGAGDAGHPGSFPGRELDNSHSRFEGTDCHLVLNRVVEGIQS